MRRNAQSASWETGETNSGTGSTSCTEQARSNLNSTTENGPGLGRESEHVIASSLGFWKAGRPIPSKRVLGSPAGLGASEQAFPAEHRETKS